MTSDDQRTRFIDNLTAAVQYLAFGLGLGAVVVNFAQRKDIEDLRQSVAELTKQLTALQTRRASDPLPAQEVSRTIP